MSDTGLMIEGLSCGYGSAQVLRDVDITMRPGEITCVLGRNGVGKTTLLRALMGQLSGGAGRIALDDRDLSKAPPFERARAGLGHVPQGREILPQLTVAENIRLGGFASGRYRESIPDSIWEYCPDLKSMQTRQGGNLSGGQQQQLAIARALMGEPKVLMLDEPTEGIQPNLAAAIRETIVRLNREQGMLILLVEQKIGFARRIGHRFNVLERGSVAASGDMSEMSDDVVRRHLEVA